MTELYMLTELPPLSIDPPLSRGVRVCVAALTKLYR